jgi:hypothetical protein
LRISFFTGFSVHNFEDHCHNLVAMKKYYNNDGGSSILICPHLLKSFQKVGKKCRVIQQK